MSSKGRQKGAKNKWSWDATQRLKELNCDPLEILAHIANNDWVALGYPDEHAGFTDEGESIPRIPISDRQNAAKELIKYGYSPKRQQVDLTASEGFKIIVEDYRKKE